MPKINIVAEVDSSDEQSLMQSHNERSLQSHPSDDEGKDSV